MTLQSRYFFQTSLLTGLFVLFAFRASNSNAFTASSILISHYHSAPTSALEAVSSKSTPVCVALTREEGKNEKLNKKLLEDMKDSIEIVELPCIAHADGPDYGNLAEALVGQEWEYIAVTSPEAARVLVSAWPETFSNPPTVVAVGTATEHTLRDSGISVGFVPSKATANVLVEELPLITKATVSAGAEGKDDSVCRVLYPASCRAPGTLQNGLEQRGTFQVTRLNTYDTVAADWTPDQIEQILPKIQIACFASPSAIKGWLANSDNKTTVKAACIGETSAEACRKLGWNEEDIFFPEKPGIEGWAQAVQDALNSL